MVEGSYSSTDCPDGAVMACEMPPGGDYTNDALVYNYYNMSFDDAFDMCWHAGGSPL